MSKGNGDTDRDVAERIKKARGAFGTINTDWWSIKYSNKRQNQDVNSVLLYDCETWKLTKTIIHQLQVLVSRCIRRILKIFWPVRTSNQELWATAKQRPIELEIRQRKWGWLDHTLCRPPGDIAKAALEWNPQGTRPRTTWRRRILEEIRHQGKKLERSQSTRQNPCQMAKLCEGCMFPWGMMGKIYIYIYIHIQVKSWGSMHSVESYSLVKSIRQDGHTFVFWNMWLLFRIQNYY